MKLIGFDISSSVIGACILDENFEIVQLYHICLDGSRWEKIDQAKEFIKSIYEIHNDIEYSYIEEFLLGFRTGMSSAQTLTVLAQTNGIVSYFIRKYHNKDPYYIGASTARKLCGIKVQQKGKCGLSAKEQVFNWAINGPLKDIPMEMTRTGKFKPFNYDRVDAYVIARSGVVEQLKQLKVK